MKKNRSAVGFLLLLPSLLGIFLFFVLPFFGSLYYTFTQGVADPKFVGLLNFRELSGNPVFRRAVGNTIWFLLIAIPLALGLALLLSVVAAKRPFRWQRWALLLPMVIPAASLSLGWQRFWGENGLVNRGLASAGLPAVDLLHGDGAFPLLILLYLLKNVGYLGVILTSAILSQPAEYRESFQLESDSELRYIRAILLPLISPTLLFTTVVAVMNYFLLFRDTYLLYGNDPPAQVYMLQHFMNNNFYKLNYQRLSTAAFLAVLTMTALIAVVLVVQRKAVRRVG